MEVEEKASETDEIQDQEGRYADVIRIGHSAYKFVFDFGQIVTNGETTRFHTRVVTSPDTAKGLLESLKSSIKDYESQFGRITMSD